MPGREKTREDDERELEMMSLRSLLYRSKDIAAKFGMRPEALRTVTNRIRDAHAEHTGENVDGWW
jgi:hypothetical protein